MHYFLHFSIKAGLLMIIAAALVPMALLGSIQIFLYGQALFNDRLNEAGRIAELIAKDTDQKMQNYFTLAQRLSNRPEAQAESVECNAFMAEFRRSNLDFLGAGFIDKDGVHRCASEPGRQSSPPTNFSDIHWFVRARNAYEPFASQPYWGRRRNAWMLLVVAPIRGENGDFRGTINLPLNPEALRPTIQEVLNPHASVLIVDNEGRFIAGSNDISTFSLGTDANGLSSVRYALDENDNTFKAPDPSGNPALFASAVVPSTDWRVVAYLPTDRVWASIRAEIFKLAIPWLGILMASLLLAHLFAGFIIRPIRALADLAARRQRNITGERTKLIGPSELVTLAESFNAMLDQQERSLAGQRIAAIAFDVQEGIIVTDAEHRIIRVNKAFTRITGYPESEVIGKTPSVLRSGRHDQAFYQDFHQRLQNDGSWWGEIWNRRKNGDLYPSWVSVSTVKDDTGRVLNFVAALTDISEQKQAEQTIHQLTNYDPLTGLPNRQLGMDRLRHTISLRGRHSGHGALMLLDLDNFKYLNEAVSQAVGDEILKQITVRIGTQIRQVDTLARVGGDEFILIFDDLGTDDPAIAAVHAEQVARKILECLAADFAIEWHPHPNVNDIGAIHISGSIGVVLIDAAARSAEELFSQAEAAMYQAKQEKGSSLRFFDQSMQQAINQRASLEGSLHRAHDSRELVPYYQPQVDIRGRIIGAEVLLRWQHPEHGVIPPSEFIPLAEETGLIVPIGYRVLEDACDLLVEWQSRADLQHLSLAVNVSPVQFSQADFVDSLLSLITKKQVPPERLELEITESLLLNQPEKVREDMLRLRAAGIRLAIDDFGMGYSSLSYLKRLPFTKLKIDRSFVADINGTANGAVIVKTIAALAATLELELIAEGVENDSQLAFLRELGCDAFQGYLFSRPVPLDELLPWVAEVGYPIVRQNNFSPDNDV